MAAKTENAFEVLTREEAAPEVENPAAVVTQEDVDLGLAGKAELQQEMKVASGGPAAMVDAPPTPGRTGPLPQTQPPIKPDAAKEHGEAAQERAGEMKEAGEHKAGELAESAKHTVADVRQRAEELAEAGRERAAEAGEAAREYTGAARDKAADVAHAMGDSVSQAVEYIKEHLPEVHVERAESSPEERESQALLDEAMAMAGGAPVPIRTEAPRPAPSRPAAEPAPSASAAAPPATIPGAELDTEPFRAYEPRTATDVANRAAERAAEVSEAARAKAAEMVHRTPGSAAAPEHTGGARQAAKEAAPDELAARVEREEQSAKGPLEALMDTVKSTTDYVKQHVLRSPPGSPRAGTPQPAGHPEPEVVVVRRTGSGRVHEYSALPGDLHPAQLARAARVVREKVLHAPAATEATAAEARDATVGGMRAAGQEIEGTARAATDKAEGAYEQARDTAGSAADAAAAKLDAAKRAVTEGAGRAADTARDTAGRAGDAAREAAGRAEARAGEAGGGARGLHEKHEGAKAAAFAEGRATEAERQELQQGAEHWNPPPKTPEDAARQAGIIPSDTESLLKQRGGAAYEAHEAREDEERNKIRTSELLDEASLAYGEENLAPGDLSDVKTEAEGGGPLADMSRGGAGAGEGLKGALGRVSAGAKEDAVQDLGKDEPGDEGEIPS
ncbi:hypothetical protein CHLNCDRAFT_137371 [Chlorella variabilis]|uniref:Uncharacterized protein n=1 Tax=Chlorella variabilis TaxID=554065 RepID=E1ZMA3_CHLVA|nr:hypothetical protein CHLNCDRAFT_137371 [Chlorella variabilis]EFN53073.1 hypothetical protein CHLNCDRAFT_137371 [Chlorella variabilis]|eukprot:XP_005845175.1 hypothetical protein CHLNCDRAFT_137371 [Chlorella variabilis]